MHTENIEAIEAQDEREAGFTLIELLVVIIVIGILAAIAIPVFLNQRQRAHDAKVKANVHSVAMALESKLTSDPTVSTLTMEDAYDEGGRINEDVIMSVSGGASGYCIQGYSPNGKQHVEESPLRYDSSAGGFLADDAEGVDCPSDGSWDIPWQDSDGEVPSWDAPGGSGTGSGNTPPPWVSGGGGGASGGTTTMNPVIAGPARFSLGDFETTFRMQSKSNSQVSFDIETTGSGYPETFQVRWDVTCQQGTSEIYEIEAVIPANGSYTINAPDIEFCSPSGEYANNYPSVDLVQTTADFNLYAMFGPQQPSGY